MKVLYAVQATGNGHLSRCLEFYPALSQYAEVDLLLSGIQGDLQLPFPIKYKMHGLSFIFGKTGGIDYLRTAMTLKPLRFLRDMLSLDVSSYDLVVSDFEPISAWACRKAKVDCVALSHQAAFLSDKTPRPQKRSWIAEMIFKYFAPCRRAFGLHYQSYDSHVYTPVVRTEIRELDTDYDEEEVLVYLPAYSEELLVEKLRQIKGYRWRVFSKHVSEKSQTENVYVYPVGTSDWQVYMGLCPRAIIGGGFEGPSEMLYLQKKIMVIPMNDQYEQLCNAAALKEMGVSVAYEIGDTFVDEVNTWLGTAQVIPVDFPKQSDRLARLVLGVDS